jgi:hypothetical protein
VTARSGPAPPRATRAGLAARAGLALLVAGAAGCASLPLALASLRPLPRACPGPLLPIAAMGADFALQARYRARRGEREEALLLAAEKRGARLVVVGLDPFGTQVFAVVQEGASVRRERHLRPLFPFAPENALRDLVEARFPEAVDALPAAADERAARTREGAAVHLVRPRCGWEATVELQAETGRGASLGSQARASQLSARISDSQCAATRQRTAHKSGGDGQASGSSRSDLFGQPHAPGGREQDHPVVGIIPRSGPRAPALSLLFFDVVLHVLAQDLDEGVVARIARVGVPSRRPPRGASAADARLAGERALDRFLRAMGSS